MPQIRQPQPKKISKARVRAFRDIVYAHAKTAGRNFAWRNTCDPYAILVSEIMLQQTQVDRVSEKYSAFLRRFPSVGALAGARLGSVLKEWQGLGYNRRAKMLWEAARQIAKSRRGRIPQNTDELESLPGIGPYTAAAVMAFAYNMPVVMIETNIRASHLHYFFPNEEGIHDAQLLPLISQTLDAAHPRKWYSSLMDYGAHLKKTLPNPSRKSRHHTRQSRFEGSDRQIRGSIIRELIRAPHQTLTELAKKLDTDTTRVRSIITKMHDEGLVKKRGSKFVIA